MKKNGVIKSDQKQNISMATSYGILNLIDYITTKRILKDGGEECNPIVDFLIKKNCFGAVKIASTLIGMYVIYNEKSPKFVSRSLLTVCSIVVANNVTEILKYKEEIKK